ncbi:hypothetical protein DS901_03040 [Loktanella sp. D2R18]|uniref:eCIS core domain-containing protein n=1 Tax=Rhodobacterales TaxID=204455 RepID=UPI000DE9A11D|nr:MULTISPECIES: DUF4157 domain-containing protein [Rhodobacterales]MDO6589369.1 DUF4157 domain-containing protein [Yoonia sp. 1_MG-2023]RBW45220.1 hypothetical protein DS901_03040 [Loktanella sp. D2R18]
MKTQKQIAPQRAARPRAPKTGGPLQRAADDSAASQSLTELQLMADSRPTVQRAEDAEFQAKFIQRAEAPAPKANNTGLPDNLKSGIENLSGMSMDHVRVHRNSDKPATVQAHAYAQGSNIHLGPGQEKHLPHEAWHVVQQAQGRVKPTMQLKGVAVNDDVGLEREADVMGAKAAQLKTVPNADVSKVHTRGTMPMQLKLADGWGEPLDDAALEKLKQLFQYRHGDQDYGNFKSVIEFHQKQGGVTTIPQLVAELKSRADDETKEWRRVGLLLELIVNQFEDWAGTTKDGPTGREAWNDVGNAFSFISKLCKKYPSFNTDVSHDEYVPLLADSPDHLFNTIGQDQWQAAAVSAVRAGKLTQTGFYGLCYILGKGLNGVTLRETKDLVHEFDLQDNPDSIGTMEVPDYIKTEKTLNSALSFFSTTSAFKSGGYSKKLKVIFKDLDVGHKLVDWYENMAHRTEGKQVDPNVSFNFLALLSPKDGENDVIGANGQVLGDGSYMYTIDPSLRVRYMAAANFVGEGGVAKNFFQFIPHSQLASLGAVVAAGNFVISGGKLVWLDNGSGHYRVDSSVNNANASAALKNIGYDLTGVALLDRGKGDLDERYKEGNKNLDGLPKGEERPEMTPEIRIIQHVMKFMSG